MDDKLDNLRFKIEERLQRENFIDNGEEISLNTLQETLEKTIGKYNRILLDDTKDLTKNINQNSFLNRIFKHKVPLIQSINPVVFEDGNYCLEVIFTDKDGKYKGDAIIEKDFKIIISNLKSGYSKEETIEMLKKYSIKYINYFEQLLHFSLEYPNTNYSWGFPNDSRNQKIDDGFLTAHFYLDNLSSTAFTFSDMEDNALARTKTKKYGELYDYIDFYRGLLLKNTSVNINDLNELYQKIVRRELNLEKDQSLKMSKLHKYML